MEKHIETIDNTQYGGALFELLTYKLDYTNAEDKKMIPDLINEMIEKTNNEFVINIEIKNIISNDFSRDYLEPAGNYDCYEDSNGWELDWWNHFIWNGERVEVHGCAWYGTVLLFLDDE